MLQGALLRDSTKRGSLGLLNWEGRLGSFTHEKYWLVIEDQFVV